MNAIVCPKDGGTDTFQAADVTVVDKKPRLYLVCVAPTHVTVLAGPITRRSLGRTFHTLEELAKHYKRDGDTLREVVAEIQSRLTPPRSRS